MPPEIDCPLSEKFCTNSRCTDARRACEAKADIIAREIFWYSDFEQLSAAEIGKKMIPHVNTMAYELGVTDAEPFRHFLALICHKYTTLTGDMIDDPIGTNTMIQQIAFQPIKLP